MAQLRQHEEKAASSQVKRPGRPNAGREAAAELDASPARARSTACKITGGQGSVPQHHRQSTAQPASEQSCDGAAVLEPETPSPVNRRDPLALDSSCSSSDEEVSVERGRKRSLDHPRGHEAAALATARARAAEERAALAEAALVEAQDRADAAEAGRAELLADSAKHAERIVQLEKQLHDIQLQRSVVIQPSRESSISGHPGCQQASSAHGAGPVSANIEAGGTQQHQEGDDDDVIDDVENAEPMDLWPPPGLSGCELDFCADGEAAASAERATELAQQVTALEADLESQSERLTAAFARMGAMCDVVRGAAKIAFSGNDLSARRLRHHIFQ